MSSYECCINCNQKLMHAWKMKCLSHNYFILCYGIQAAISKYANVGLTIASVTLYNSPTHTVSVTATVSVASDDSLSAGEITGIVIGIVIGGTLLITIAITSFCL